MYRLIIAWKLSRESLSASSFDNHNSAWNCGDLRLENFSWIDIDFITYIIYLQRTLLGAMVGVSGGWSAGNDVRVVARLVAADFYLQS